MGGPGSPETRSENAAHPGERHLRDRSDAQMPSHGSPGDGAQARGEGSAPRGLAKTRRMIEHEIRTLLVADGNDAERASITEALRGEDVQITGVRAGKQALDALRKNQFDCMVLGSTFRDTTAIDLIKKIVQSETASELPIVIYETDALSGSERDKVRKLAEVAVLKSARTLEAA